MLEAVGKLNREDREKLTYLDVPVYESTKSLSAAEREAAIKGTFTSSTQVFPPNHHTAASEHTTVNQDIHNLCTVTPLKNESSAQSDKDPEYLPSDFKEEPVLLINKKDHVKIAQMKSSIKNKENNKNCPDVAPSTSSSYNIQSAMEENHEVCDDSDKEQPSTSCTNSFDKKTNSKKPKMTREKDKPSPNFIETSDSSLYDSDKDPEYIPSDVEEEPVLLLNKKDHMKIAQMKSSIKNKENNKNCPDVGPSTSSSYNIQSAMEETHEVCDDSDNEQPSTSCTNSFDKKTNSKKPKRTREKDLCFYCDSMVLNFARHLQRNHTSELDVQKVMTKSPKSKERKHLIDIIRKKGNYILNSTEQCVKPVRKSNMKVSEHNCLPCTFCLGFFSRKQLYRHRTHCLKNPSKAPSTLSDAQTFLNRHVYVDPKLKKEVFPHMQANDRSFEAKRDELICAYGARYLKTHKGKHHIPVCSRKMQELARLLIEAKKIKPEVKSLIQALKPENYDTIVQATKNAASYNEETETFKSPTYAMNIGKSLKDCCDIAVTLILKGKSLRNSTGINLQENLKTTIHLIESNWQYDISSQAATNLNINRWNKVTLVPLASDIKLFKEYLEVKGQTAAETLKHSPNDENAFRDLQEICYARTLLLNRKRPGELQRMEITTYDKAQSRSTYEEFQNALTATEKILVKRFKRVVIEGKRKRGVPVLFPNDVQEHIQLFRNVRANFFNNINNPYLFATPRCTTPICGYKVLQKLSRNCKAKNPEALSATRLRKHLATINQILHLTDNDVEQLATFMGHTEKIHRGEYRLPDDVYQTAKVCKLLLMMESGEADKYKGKSINEINMNMEEDLSVCCNEELDDPNLDDLNTQPDEVFADVDDPRPLSAMNDEDCQRNQTINPNASNTPKIKKARELVPWTTGQKKVVMNYFKAHIKQSKPPKKHECELLKSMNKELLENKSWLKIKVYVQNIYTKNKKA